jgi:hypothetical protein
VEESECKTAKLDKLKFDALTIRHIPLAPSPIKLCNIQFHFIIFYSILFNSIESSKRGHTSEELKAALLTDEGASAEEASMLVACTRVFVDVLPPEGIPNRPLLLAVASARLLQVGTNRTQRALNHRSAILMFVYYFSECDISCSCSDVKCLCN